MRVQLTQATPDAGRMIADIASICYGKEEAQFPGKLLKHLFENGHHSAFEHAYYTFKIEGISRACLGQLVRHRHTSPTVQSQRYVDQSENEVIIPETIQNNPEALEIFDDTVRDSKNAYKTLRLLGIPKEDARYILPEGIETEKYMSLNLRELIHICKLRDSKEAQWEIKEVAKKMRELVLAVSPELTLMFEGAI